MTYMLIVAKAMGVSVSSIKSLNDSRMLIIRSINHISFSLYSFLINSNNIMFCFSTSRNRWV